MIGTLTICHGNVTAAASRLGVNRRTISRWMNRYPHLRQLVDAERDRILDKAEVNIFEAMERGDLRASWFVLRTLGKDRGYAERTEVDQSVPTTPGKTLEPSFENSYPSLGAVSLRRKQ